MPWGLKPLLYLLGPWATHCTSKLGKASSRDSRNLSAKLKSHEISDEYITNMNVWIDLDEIFKR